MSCSFSKPQWSVRVNVKIRRLVPQHLRSTRTRGAADAGRVAAMFGLREGHCEVLYEDYLLEISSGQIVAVVGPSGAGKSVLLREVAAQVPGAVWMDLRRLGQSDTPAVAALTGAGLAERLEMLSRCGLAEATALVSPARQLSGGQLHRLALARALFEARRRGRPTLVIADEFAACLDDVTAGVLCRQMRKLLGGRASALALLVATPRASLLDALQPDQVVIKPLGEPPRLGWAASGRSSAVDRSSPRRWRISRGTMKDYEVLGQFHYLAGPPAAHKRVYVIRPPRSASVAGAPDVAAVLVVSPPLLNVRGRNLATAGRYSGGNRAAALALLNAEVECISRVVVHPVYRGCGLAVRLVRQAILDAQRPLVEALAAMGAVHPFFERAGMKAYRIAPDEPMTRLLSAAEAVGLTVGDLAAVGPVKRLLRRKKSGKACFLSRELDRCIARTFSRSQLARLADPLAEMCRRCGRQYVYYLAPTAKEPKRCR